MRFPMAAHTAWQQQLSRLVRDGGDSAIGWCFGRGDRGCVAGFDGSGSRHTDPGRGLGGLSSRVEEKEIGIGGAMSCVWWWCRCAGTRKREYERETVNRGCPDVAR
ncbi:hypothetical protein K402DRAFT_183655 [Aulographum hederae CBS 113979]|uniref:Uncharacterized protein n=1 Tax=Aulographum hederae CBS 113979 TaxID=1176131 RepID=A0A6G1GQ24_9PEZI|nr:hypothetical protein K402DRAFT_183655 [Aulographum hederae CBS 113979]